MNENYISLKKLNGIVIDSSGEENNELLVLTFNSNLMNLGYVLSKELYYSLVLKDEETIKTIANDTINNLKKIVGSDVKYKPMYPNFPQQVVNATDVELFVNAIVHYWSFGTILPEYREHDRSFAFEDNEITELQMVSEDDFNNIFIGLLSSKDSISELDTKIIQWFLDNYEELEYPNEIGYKEILCLVAADQLNKGNDISRIVKTGKDVMRVYAYISEQDHTLSNNNIVFKNLPRSKRKKMTKALENVLTLEETKTNSNLWVRMFHALHVGDYSKKVYDIAKSVRENEKIKTFNSHIEEYIEEGYLQLAIDLLKKRPSMYARRLDELLMKFDQDERIINNFEKIVDQIPNRVLFQLIGHFRNRNYDVQERYVMPKGMSQNVFVLNQPLNSLKNSTIKRIVEICENQVIQTFSQMDNIGNVYIDEEMMNCPIPTQMRSSSEAKKEIARGTKIKFEKDTIRFFIYWVGRDIDLSATLYDENYQYIEHCSYTNLRGDGYHHSGDITSAPNGASEFIDIDVNDVLKNEPDVRYVAMQVYVYSGPTFEEHETVYCGWMERDHPNSNEIYDPKTVKQKVDLTSKSSVSIPVFLDLKEKTIIWCDTNAKDSGYSKRYVKNVENYVGSVSDVTKFFNERNNKISLYDLFVYHALSRGNIVDNPDEADMIVSWDGDMTPYHINEINSSFV